MKNDLESRRSVIEHFKEDFCTEFMNRLYPKIKWYAGLEESKFLLFINIIDRSDEESIRKETLIYAGINEQRRFLNSVSDLDPYWEELNKGEILAEDSIEGGRLLDEFKAKKLGMNDIKIKSLRYDYFANYFKDKTFNNTLQEFEFPILNHHFNIGEDYFLSLPLIQFGDFDGVVHIIFEKKARSVFKYKKTQIILIKMLSEELEAILLEWDLVGDNIKKQSLLKEQLRYLTTKEYEDAATTNPIFSELGYRVYYTDATPHYEKRVEHNDAIPEAFKNEHRKRAIISILIDSYAHNISAHSLTVLKWWFQQRAMNFDVNPKLEEIEEEMPVKKWGSVLVDFLMKKFPEAYTRQEIESGLKYNLARWNNMLEKRRENVDFKAVRDQFFPLEKELTPLFKFLLEKGAFWSGVTRDQQFGGEIHNIYKVLWNDFIQNPLYLGTIAYSEGITKLNICIRLYSEDKYKGDKDDFFRTYKLRQNEEGLKLNGVLATIDVGGAPFHPDRHRFVEPGAIHDELKKVLEQCEVFFPGGVVGKHAFFTLLENEIRNVKHFSEEDRKQMQKDGLNLVVAIRPGSLSSQLGYTVRALYKIGVWLGHPTRFDSQKGHLAALRFNRLLEDIITPETNEARLGGTYQDKICSAMLFNNTFVSVEKQKSKRDKVYYPWVRVAFSSGLEKDDLTEIDFEINNRNVEAVPDRLDKGDLSLTGYFKKYIHLWRGDFIFHAIESKNLEVENVNRFRIVNLATPDKHLREKLLREGAIRILEKQPSDVEPTIAYHQWLLKWMKEDYFAIRLLQGKTEVGYIFFDEQEAKYLPKAAFNQLTSLQKEEYGEYPENDLKFAHNSSAINENQNKVLSIRSNGILREKFFPNVQSVEDFAEGEITELALYELLEVLKTKVCVFDKRIADRVVSNKRRLLTQQLACDIYSENVDDWKKVKTRGVDQYHFIVMHLSFIEGMKNRNGQRYGEEGIVDFIEEQFENLLGSNCILVITTGRGRTEWWRKIQDSDYAIHTTFRPVESLIEAVEKAILKKDDIELKYNLIKVLFGS